MLAQAMNESRSVPTATSFRTLPVDVLDAKRKALNGALKERGMKVSFTHLIAWAIVEAARWAVMGRAYAESDGKPQVIEPTGVNLGIAVDVERKDGSRSLMVPCIKGADASTSRPSTLLRGPDHKDAGEQADRRRLSGNEHHADQPGRPRHGRVRAAAAGRPGNDRRHRVDRLPGRVGAGPAEKMKALGVSKVMTMTSTYDHRIIQGAESGSFLRRIDQLLQGEDAFYESRCRGAGRSHLRRRQRLPRFSLGAARRRPAPPAPRAAPADTELLQAVQAATSLLKAYRTHGHLAADLDPLGKEPRGDPAIEPENLNLTPELMSQIPASILRIGVEGETLLEALPRMREAYCGTVAYQIEHLSSHQQRMWLREMIETGAHRTPLTAEEKRALLSRLVEVFQFERFLQRAYLGQKMFSIEGLDAVVPMIDELVTLSQGGGAQEVVLGMAHRGRLAVLAHNLGRPVESIMAEFEGAKALERVKAVAAIPHGGTGDVKYHYGAEGMFTTRDGEQIKVRLYPEPEPPGVRRSRRHRGRPRHSELRSGSSLHHDAGAGRPAASARRRGVPGPGGGRRDVEPPSAGGLLDRRHRPHHHRQPGGLHDRP